MQKLIPKSFDNNIIVGLDHLIGALPFECDEAERSLARTAAWLATGTLTAACGMVNDRDFQDLLDSSIVPTLDFHEHGGIRRFYRAVINLGLTNDAWPVELQPIVHEDVVEARVMKAMSV